MEKVLFIVASVLCQSPCFARGLQSTISDYSAYSQDQLNVAFVEAVKHRSVDQVHALLKAGANVKTTIKYMQSNYDDHDSPAKDSALGYAAKYNLVEMTNVLIEYDKDINTVLPRAIREESVGVVRALIRGGADVNEVVKDRSGAFDTKLYVKTSKTDTPLMLAIGLTVWESRDNSQRQRVIQSLLQAGATITKANQYGVTPLMLAIQQHDLQTVERLLAHPAMKNKKGLAVAPINQADQHGYTALMHAISSIKTRYISAQQRQVCEDSQEIVKRLLSFPGVDKHKKSKNGKTALVLMQELKEKLEKSNVW